MASTSITDLAAYFALLRRYPNRRRGLCIGDSWFQYPLRNYADLQRRIAFPSELGSRVNFVDDSYPGRDADEVRGLYKRWLRLARTLQEDFKPFDLFLVSLGGNDVVGLDFVRHLSGGTATNRRPWPWSDDVPSPARRWMDLAALEATFLAIVDAYGLIIAIRDEYAPAATIITHSYADVTPSNVPYRFATFRSGPWIWAPATERGVPPADQKIIVRWLLLSFANLLRTIGSATRDPARFVVLDTRLELSDPADWDNEIHPLGPGFRHLVDHYWRPAIEAVL